MAEGALARISSWWNATEGEKYEKLPTDAELFRKDDDEESDEED